LVVVLSFASARALAQAGAVQVDGAWARATVPGQGVGAVYLKITSPQDAKLTGVKTAVAKSAEIHSMSHEGGVMKMRRLDALDLPAGRTVVLEPGGDHIMLIDLAGPLKAGQRVQIQLTVERLGKRMRVPVSVQVRSAAPAQSAR
jgi:copper(I)-binding protein